MSNLTADDFVRLVTLYIPENVTALAFSPDGSILAVAAADKVHLYHVPERARPQAKQNAAPGNN
jgi:WD40 repeat protein